MDFNKFPEIKPGIKPIKRLYIAIMLWFVGRAIQAAGRVDKGVKAEFAGLRDDFIVRLGVLPKGPAMLVGKDKKGRAKFLGMNPQGKKITLDMVIKNIEGAFLMLAFMESTPIAYAHERLYVSGDLPDACAFARSLEIVEVLLLPKIIAKLAVKRYPKWSQMTPLRKYMNRVLVYVLTIAGF
jgi:hypothetical protein